VALLCAGCATDLEALKVLGVDHTVLYACDRKPAAQEFMRSRFPKEFAFGHLFDENESAIAGCGKCLSHGGTCRVDHRRVPHVTSVGFPCQPFSPQRHRGGEAPRCGEAQEISGRSGDSETAHPDFPSIMEDWLRYVKRCAPQCWLVEEVPGFAVQHGDDGRSFLDVFLRAVVREGYAVRVFQLDHNQWCKFPRARLFIVGFGADAGHKAAAEWFTGELQAFLALRELGKPIDVFNTEDRECGTVGVLDPAATDEAAMADTQASLVANERAAPWPTWKTDSGKIHAAEGIPKRSQQWTADPAHALHGVPDLPRLRDLLDTCYAIAQKSKPGHTKADVARSLYCDVSQSIARRPWANTLRTATQNSCFYAFEFDRVISGAEHLRLLGWSSRRLTAGSLTDRDFRSVSGESFSLVWATVLHALLYCNPYGSWWTA